MKSDEKCTFPSNFASMQRAGNLLPVHASVSGQEKVQRIVTKDERPKKVQRQKQLIFDAPPQRAQLGQDVSCDNLQ